MAAYGFRRTIGGRIVLRTRVLSNVPIGEKRCKLAARIDGLQGVHSARHGYSPRGAYGDRDRDSGRTMAIRISEEALATQLHPLVRRHPETGRPALFVSTGFMRRIVGMQRGL